MTDVQGRIAFITGGANAIGLGMARTFAPSGIGVSVLCPGPVATDIVNRSASAAPTSGAL